jgi:hypothetical protein
MHAYTISNATRSEAVSRAELVKFLSMRFTADSIDLVLMSLNTGKHVKLTLDNDTATIKQNA